MKLLPGTFNSRKSYLLALLLSAGTFLSSPEGLKAQVNTAETESSATNIGLKSSVYGGTAGSLPFWFYANVDGTVDPSGANWLNELSAEHNLLDREGFTIDMGGNAVFRLSDNSSIHFTELYLRARAFGLQLEAGRFPQPIGLNNHELSVGSMMVSRNAIPVPRISLSTPEFMDVPFLNGHVQYKGLFTHGWMEEDRRVSNPYLHQKYLYLRVNAGPFSGTGGLVHNVIWGGNSPTLGRLPQSFGDYLRVITGRAASVSSNAPGADIANVIGNSIAAYDFGLTYEQDTYSLSLTRMFYLEDKVSTRFRSPWDGVWGLNLKLKDEHSLVKALTYEHINTKNQDAKNFELIGRRDYYDHGQYPWVYENRTIGIPLILFDGNTISNNVLVGHHFGIKGEITSKVSYTGFFTYSRNYGIQHDWVSSGDFDDSIPKDREDIIPREQFREDQYSMMLGFDYRPSSVDNITLNLKLSADLGELYEDNFGLMAGFSWLIYH